MNKQSTTLLILIVVILLGGFLYVRDSKNETYEPGTVKFEDDPLDDPLTFEDVQEKANEEKNMPGEGQNEETVKEDTSEPIVDETPEEQEEPGIEGLANVSHVIDMTGKNYEFSVEEIRVREGDMVTINFTSESGFHDWTLDEFNVRTIGLRAGESDSITFVVDEKGTFEYYCSIGSHRQQGMVGNLIVE